MRTSGNAAKWPQGAVPRSGFNLLRSTLSTLLTLKTLKTRRAANNRPRRPASCHSPGLCPENVPLSGERFSPSGENSRRPREAQFPPRKRLVVRGIVPTSQKRPPPSRGLRPASHRNAGQLNE